jgi:hypothetical protein
VVAKLAKPKSISINKLQFMNSLIFALVALPLWISAVPAIAQNKACSGWGKAGYAVGWIIREYGIQLSPTGAVNFCAANASCRAEVEARCGSSW